MPTYSYECTKCGHVFDVFHKMSEDPRVKCEECGGRCKRLFGTGAGIIFKGSGFYETDFKEKKGKPEGAGEKKPEGGEKKSEGGDAKPTASPETKTESKPEKKTETKPAVEPKAKSSSKKKHS